MNEPRNVALILQMDDLELTMTPLPGASTVDVYDVRGVVVAELVGERTMTTRWPCPLPELHGERRHIRSLLWEATKRFIGGRW